MFFFQNPRRQRLHRVAIQHRHRGLQHDRPCIQMLVHEMHRASADLHAMSQRLRLRIQTLEKTAAATDECSGSACGNSLDERGAEQAHKPGQADQVHRALFSTAAANLRSYSSRATPFDGRHTACKAQLPRRLQPACLRRGSKSRWRSRRPARPPLRCRAIASKLEPRPEIRMPSRFIRTSHAVLRRLHTTDPITWNCSPILRSTCLRLVLRCARQSPDHPDPQVESAPVIV